MSQIYVPGKAANEYSRYAVNLYTGCNHGCKYCYAPAANRKKREDYFTVIPTKDTLKHIERDAHHYKGENVLLCFLTDPYNSLDTQLQLTRQAIKALRDNGVNPVILSKAGALSTRDFDLLDSSSWYGSTLTFVNDEDSMEWEPFAALPEERMAVLKEAHERGINTWVSLEPVIIPEQTFELIHLTHGFVDHYKVGKWNHDQRANSTDWKKFHSDAKTIMKKYGIKQVMEPKFEKGFYVKSDLIKECLRVEND